VEARQRVQLTSTNDPFGLAWVPKPLFSGSGPRFRATRTPYNKDGNVHFVARSRSARESETRSPVGAASPLERADGRSMQAPTYGFLVVMAEGPYPIPSRTRKSSPPAPMVLQGPPCGRVGRHQIYAPDTKVSGACFFNRWRARAVARDRGGAGPPAETRLGGRYEIAS
jgi:hypothetical protein